MEEGIKFELANGEQIIVLPSGKIVKLVEPTEEQIKEFMGKCPSSEIFAELDLVKRAFDIVGDNPPKKAKIETI